MMSMIIGKIIGNVRPSMISRSMGEPSVLNGIKIPFDSSESFPDELDTLYFQYLLKI